MSIGGFIRAKYLQKEIERRDNFYHQQFSETERLEIQLNRLNAAWKTYIEKIPYYKNLLADGAVPSQFEDWHQFVANVPIMSRELIQQNGQQMFDHSRRIDFYRTTGGSTGQPIRIPAWKSEVRHSTPNMWLGRYWNDIQPQARGFYIWGHSHLYGAGINQTMNVVFRKIKDIALGYHRFSAYDMNPSRLEECTRKIITTHPEYLIGYASSIDRLARFNRTSPDLKSLQQCGLKKIIVTAETLPFEDSIQVIEETFQVPVVLEYGANEADVIAYTTETDRRYQVFWNDYFIEKLPESNQCLVTSLDPRCFPLIRYAIQDTITTEKCQEDHHLGVAQINTISGKVLRIIELENGDVVHAAIFSKGMRIFDIVLGYQIVITPDGLFLDVVIREGVDKAEILQKIKQRVHHNYPNVGHFTVRSVDHLKQTISGKTPVIWKEEK